MDHSVEATCLLLECKSPRVRLNYEERKNRDKLELGIAFGTGQWSDGVGFAQSIYLHRGMQVQDYIGEIRDEFSAHLAEWSTEATVSPPPFRRSNCVYRYCLYRTLTGGIR